MRVPRLVSVVIPSYDRAVSLMAAIDSVLAQSHGDVEVLVCDDGSTDDSRDRVLALGDPRVRWLPGARSGGPSQPRNRGMAAAKGEWIAFLDSDDVWYDDKLAVQLAAMEATGLLASTTNGHRLPMAGPSPAPALVHPRLPAVIGLDALLSRNQVMTSAVLFHERLRASLGGFVVAAQHSVFEDYAMWLRVASYTSFAVVDLPLVGYRDAPTASYRSTYSPDLVCTLRALRDFRNWERQSGASTGWTLRRRRLAAAQLARLCAVRQLAPWSAELVRARVR